MATYEELVYQSRIKDLELELQDLKEILSVIKKHAKIHRKRVYLSVSHKTSMLVPENIEININKNDEDFNTILEMLKKDD